MANIRQKQHKIGQLGLILSAMTAMIGSGWLFGAWKSATIAGPAALISWGIGAIIALLIALTFADLGSRIPKIGGMVRYTHLSHGSFAGFISAWAIWISIVSVIPIEAVASVQYISSWQWAHGFYNAASGQLTHTGICIAAALVLVYFLLNYWSVKLFMRSTIAITVFKVTIPIMTVAALIIHGLTNHHLSATHGGAFMPYGVSGIFTAVALGGIVFAFNGFQVVINLSGESKNAKKHVPIAVCVGIFLVFMLYELLQYTFLSSVSTNDLIHGWHGIEMNSPFVQLIMGINIYWLVMLLYIDSFVSPSGTGITYVASTSRMLYGMHKNGHMPSFIGHIHKLYHISRPAMWVNLGVSYLFLFVFRGWGSLAAIISVTTIISYINGPISAITLQTPEQKRTLLMRLMPFIAPCAFILATLILYWARWPLTGEVILIVFVGLPIYFYYESKKQWYGFYKHFKAGLWLIVYLAVIAILSCIGSKSFGGYGWLNNTASTIAVVLAGAVFYIWGIKSSLKRSKYPVGETDRNISTEIITVPRKSVLEN